MIIIVTLITRTINSRLEAVLQMLRDGVELADGKLARATEAEVPRGRKKWKGGNEKGGKKQIRHNNKDNQKICVYTYTYTYIHTYWTTSILYYHLAQHHMIKIMIMMIIIIIIIIIMIWIYGMNIWYKRLWISTDASRGCASWWRKAASGWWGGCWRPFG